MVLVLGPLWDSKQGLVKDEAGTREYRPHARLIVGQQTGIATCSGKDWVIASTR